MSSEGAKRGFSRETKFVNLINNNRTFKQHLEEALTQLKILKGHINAAVDVKQSCKSDVKLITNNRNNKELGCSLKAAESNFNQLDRRWLSDWAAVLQMPQPIQDMIQASLDRKKVDSRGIFILPEQEKAVISFLELSKETLLKELFTKEDENLKAFVAYDEKQNKWFVSSIDDIIRALKAEPITRSNKGVIHIGDCLSLQRKGGDGNIKNPPKTSSLHPSNHLQFKIKPLSVIQRVKSIEIKV